MAVTRVDDFFKLLEKSSLLTAEQFQGARQQLAGESDAKTVARKLLTDGKLSKWQALQLLNGRCGLTIGPYKLLDALAADNVVRTFQAQHAESGQLVELRSLSRSHAAERPEAVDEFIAEAEKTAGSSSRKVLEVHRAEAKDDTCYVVLEAAGAAPAAAAAGLSDSSVEKQVAINDSSSSDQEGAAAATEPAAEQPVAEESVKPAEKESAAKEPAVASVAPEGRPPKLKPKSKPADSAPAPTGSDSAAAEAKEKEKAAPAAAEEPKLEIKLPGEAPADAVSFAPGELKIAKGKRRKKPGAAPADKPAKAAKAEAGASGEGEETAAPASPPKRAVSPKLLIGGAVGGGLLLVTLAAVAWFMFSGGDSDQVADAGGGKPPAEKATEAPQEGEAKPGAAATEAPDAATSEPADPVVSDPVIDIQPTVLPAAEMKPDVKPEATTGKTEAPVAAAKPGEMAKTGDSSQAASKPAEAPAAPGGESGKEPAAGKTADPGKPDEKPKPEENPKPDEAAKSKPEPKGSEGKKEAAKPADKKAPAPPPGKKPFADLKAVAALPDASAPDANQPKVLGSVYIPTGELCFVKLRGGAKASKGAQQFVMKNAREGLADKEWEIFVRESAGTETIVAQMAINDKSELVFSWHSNAKTQPLSPFLCNCAFSLACAGESAVITLREPVTAEGLAVDFDKPTSKADWKIDLCPDPDAIRVQITGVQGAKVSVDPTDPLPASKATAWVKVEDGGGMLSLKVDPSLKGNFQLTASPHIKTSPDVAKPEKFVRRMFQDALKKAEMGNQQASQFLQGMEQFIKSKAPEGERKQVEQRMSLAKMEVGKLETQLQNMKKIDELLKSLGEGMKIQFRVYYDADSSEVVLLKTEN